ncbi:LCP family glycopolymer transferase [Ornithinimicrobium panacihumi]|uniref:LCP family protein n=1 Tax=Ornithinimicrobium panacihumi TaxID=2008449 RepID=UPI003F8B79C1
MGYQEHHEAPVDEGRRPRRRRRPVRTAAAVVGIFALLGVIALAGFAFYLQNTAERNIVHEDLLSKDNAVITISPQLTGGERPSGDDGEEQDDAEGGDGEPAEDEEPIVIVGEDGQEVEVQEGTTHTATTPERATEAGEALNFLIIGSDSRDLSVERGRSDVIVLMHINDQRDRVDLIHFPRDTFVPIPGTGGSSKINAAYAYGGAPLLVQTLQQQVNVPIDHVVIVNFESFKAMTDAIGGVDVNVTQAGGGFSTGVQHMNGEQGLRFVRERYSLSQGDISRGERQMQFIKGIITKALSRETLTNPGRIAGFVDAATTNLTVDEDLRVGDMRDLGFSMRNVRGGDIHFWSGPWCGIADHPVAGSIILKADAQMARLAEALRSDSMSGYVDNVSPRSGFGGGC